MNHLATGVGVSLAVHAALFLVAGGWGHAPPAVAMTPGLARISVRWTSPAVEPRPTAPVAAAEADTAADPAAALALVEGVEWLEQPQYAQNPPPAYPREAFWRNQQGRVQLLVDLDARGRPTQVAIERSSGFVLLDTAAAAAVRRWRFVPARRWGLPVASRTRVPIVFRIVEAQAPASHAAWGGE